MSRINELSEENRQQIDNLIMKLRTGYSAAAIRIQILHLNDLYEDIVEVSSDKEILKELTQKLTYILLNRIKKEGRDAASWHELHQLRILLYSIPQDENQRKIRHEIETKILDFQKPRLEEISDTPSEKPIVVEANGAYQIRIPDNRQEQGTFISFTLPRM